jgi:formate dehydrogenase major subunit
MVIGSNAAENHPMSFKYIKEAQAKGAKLITVDPRFTKTAAQSDVYAPLRSGTDIALIGSVINYAIAKGLLQRDYLLTHTNASYLVKPEYKFSSGMFGQVKDGKYDSSTWAWQKDEEGKILTDPTLQNPSSVFQLLKAHYSRYDFKTVSGITGTPVEKLEAVASTFCATHKPEKSATILYAMGTTQHTYGTQNVRSYAVLQLLLGNIGVAGGGINALRGESNVQGSTDHGLLFHILPGYLKSPEAKDESLETYLKTVVPPNTDPQSQNWWANAPKYVTSLLKAWWGDKATKENDFAFSYLPKRGGNYSHIALFEAMAKGKIKGLIAFGQNPAVGGPNSNAERAALKNLEWMVAVDLFETDTSVFWKAPGFNPSEIKTEVFLLPAAASVEKEGSVSNSGRWAQWRYHAADAPGVAKSDLWILTRFVKELKRLYKAGGAFPDPILDLTWSYGDGEEPSPHLVAKEINGYFLADTEIKGKAFKKGDLVPGFANLAADGTTSSGNWLYSGSYVNEGNLMARRTRTKPEKDPLGLHPEWAWCWPVNRRILYNRASCDAKGKPYAPKKKVVEWDPKAQKWHGDVPDGPWPPPLNEDGTQNPAGRHAFIMVGDGRAALFAPRLADGPFPEHYEPHESPVVNHMSPQQHNPVITVWRPEEVGKAEQFPIVASTYRVTEHWQAGAMTRNIPLLVELVPEPFVEMSRELARTKGIKTGDKVTVTSKRGSIELKAVVTPRLKPFKLKDKEVHQVGIIWHFGYNGLATGPSANVLTAHIGDANTNIPEYKAFLCDLNLSGKGGRS